MEASNLDFDEMRCCIAHHTERERAEVVGPARLVEDLGVDSLTMHALLIDIEEAGGRIPPPETLEAVNTVDDLFAAVTGDALP